MMSLLHFHLKKKNLLYLSSDSQSGNKINVEEMKMLHIPQNYRNVDLHKNNIITRCLFKIG